MNNTDRLQKIEDKQDIHYERIMRQIRKMERLLDFIIDFLEKAEGIPPYAKKDAYSTDK
jgi:hypothetical protein